MEQIAQECRIGLVSYTITHHTRQSAIGLPYIQQKIYGARRISVTEYTMSEIVAAIYDKIEDTGLKEGILFIDEINCVSETLAPTMLQFLQAKTFGNHKIPDGWVIVAAGNPPEYNKSVREFDVVTLDRVKLITVEADLSVWKEYAEAVHIHPAIVSYLNVKPENFCQIETTVDGRRFVTPRGWEDLSRLILAYEKLGKTVDREVVFQYLQHLKIAKDFANYLELYYKYQKQYQVEEILEGRIQEAVCDRLARAPFDERISVVSLLSAGLNRDFAELFRQTERMERLKEIFGQLRPGKEDAVSGYENARERLAGLTAGWEAERKYRKEAGLLSRREDRLRQDVQKILEAALLQVRTGGFVLEDEVWAVVSEIFEKENDAYEELFDRCGKELEHAFDFMEAGRQPGNGNFRHRLKFRLLQSGLFTGVFL